MKSAISFNNIYKLNELYKKDRNIYKKFMYILILLILLSNGILGNLHSVNESYNLNLNVWDGIFRILSYPYFMLYVYIPATLILISPSNKLYEKYLAIRFKSKFCLIINEILFKIVITTFFTFIYMVAIIMLSSMYFKIESNWSDIILNIGGQTKYGQSMYPNNFVKMLSPEIALILNFMQINLTIILIDMMRGFLIDLKGNFKLANILISLLLLINFVLFNFPIGHKIQEILNFFLISTFVLLWNHRFDSLSFSNVTIVQSTVVLLILTMLVLVLRLAFCKGMKIIDGDWIN
ncbi:hypothetical protein [uncultured Clostridium sp.]|uniref:hypothetical protein n=1 Tax=uncultured Clostridium sp. TaxID=59620 RepID=UPI0028E47147|nr:hypothetical protein [uncultured Clostridium sp.]